MIEKGKILIVDDDKQVLRTLEFLLETEFNQVTTLNNPNQILSLVRSEEFDVILLDMNFSKGQNTGNEGFYWLDRILKIDSDSIIILITAYGDVELAVRAMREGATDFILKPFDNNKLIATIKSALSLRKSKNEIRKLKQKQQIIAGDFEKQNSLFKGKSLAMESVYAAIRKVAKTDANVLLLGENGTGKEVVAREIHRLSVRADEAFIHVDLGAVSNSLFESELFGHKKGAFTDAKADRAGRFEIASGGTLFLDEIGNIPLPLQAKLLSALQSREVIPVGSNTPVRFDVRLISATNKSIESMIKESIFREDLYYRINTIIIDIPPLRDRKEDIIPMADHFLAQFCRKYEKPNLKFNKNSYDQIQKHSWPGNVRELQHTIEKAVIMCDSSIIAPNDLMLKASEVAIIDSNPLTLDEMEKRAITKALRNNNGVLSFAAKELGIARQTLYNKMSKYGL
ncbi:MAG: sigma-54-dependent Fis family transcriptional regulator [Bacteroidales bacterium]|nr:MAG: sigma-54-dependent Fis family transcriptional regulator [Bacteroidales bacterium]